MAKTINGVTFNDLSRIGKGSSFSNVKNPDIFSEADLQDYIDAGEEYRNLQSVLIDWNGAVLPNSNTTFGTSITINTTGEIIRGTLKGN